MNKHRKGMEKYLEKYGIIDYLRVEISIDKSLFMAKFKHQVDNKNIGIFSDMDDMFSSSKKVYKGKIDSNGFKIKKKRTSFNSAIAIAEGTYRVEGSLLIIEAKINSFKGAIAFFYYFLITVYSLSIIFLLSTTLYFLFTDSTSFNPVFIGFPALLIHAVIFMTIPYIFMKYSTKSMKEELKSKFLSFGLKV